MTTTQSDPAAGVRSMGRALTITFGVLTLIAGLLVLFWPGATVLVIAVIFAIQLIIIGIYRLVLAFSAGEAATGARVLFAIIGVLSIVVGVLLLRDPAIAVVTLGLLLGLMWTVSGLIEIFHGFTGERGSGRGWLIAGGVLSLIAGIIVLVYPAASLVTIAWIMGLLLVFYGIVMIIRGIVGPRAAAA